MTTQSVIFAQQEDKIRNIVREELIPTNTRLTTIERDIFSLKNNVSTLKEDVSTLKDEVRGIKGEMLTKDEFYTAMDGYIEIQQEMLTEIAMLRRGSERHENSIEELRTISKKHTKDIRKIKVTLHLK